MGNFGSWEFRASGFAFLGFRGLGLWKVGFWVGFWCLAKGF